MLPVLGMEVSLLMNQEPVIQIPAKIGLALLTTGMPVIACPPYSDKFGGNALYSTLRLPSGVCPMLGLEPEEAGLAALKILALNNKQLASKIQEYQKAKRDEIEKADKELNKY